MNSVREIDFKNRTYYFLNDMVNIKNLHPNKIKIDKKTCKSILIYYIGYITSNSAKLLYLVIHKIKGCFEEKNENKSLTLVPTDESKDTLKNYADL